MWWGQFVDKNFSSVQLIFKELEPSDGICFGENEFLRERLIIKHIYCRAFYKTT